MWRTVEEATSGHAAEVELVEVAVVALLCLKSREEVKLLIFRDAVQGGEQLVVEVGMVLLASIAVRLGITLQVARGDQTMAQLEGDKIGQEEHCRLPTICRSRDGRARTC